MTSSGSPLQSTRSASLPTATRTDPAVQPEHPRRVDGDRPQRGLPVQSLLDRQRRLVDQEVDRHDRVVGDDRDLDPGRGQPAGVGQRSTTQFDLRPGGEQRSDQHRNVLGGQQVRDQVGLGAVIDDQPVAEFVGDPDRGGDVVRPMAVLTPRNGAGRAPRRAPRTSDHGPVAPCPPRRTPAWPGSSAPRRRPCGSPTRCRAGSTASASCPRTPASGSRRAPTSVRTASAAPSRPRCGRGCGWPPSGRRSGCRSPGLTFTVVIPPASASAKPRSAGLIASSARTPAVTGSVSSLVSLTRPPLGLLVQTEVGVRVDEPGQQPAAVGVDDGGAGRDGEVCAQRGDPAVPHPHGPVERDPRRSGPHGH